MFQQYSESLRLGYSHPNTSIGTEVSSDENYTGSEDVGNDSNIDHEIKGKGETTARMGIMAWADNWTQELLY